MWMVTLSRRDFLETVGSGPSPDVLSAARRYEPDLVREDEGKIVLLWRDEPESRESFPILAIASKQQVRDLLAAVNASPKAVSPFTAFCRVIDYHQARYYLDPLTSSISPHLIDAIAMLSLVEVQLRSGGKMKAREVSPAACRRTLCFAWAKAMRAGLPAYEVNRLPELWAEALHISYTLNSHDEGEAVLRQVLPVLTAATSVLEPSSTQSFAHRLVRSILDGDSDGKEAVWREASQSLSIGLSLPDLEKAPREERGAYLQRLFVAQSNGKIEDERSAAQGFLATQVAPGSLEHLDLLLTRSGPETAFWYVLFATLQSPVAILNAFGGTGRRISRDTRDCDSITSTPRADISLDEFRLLSRFGSEELGRKLGHSNEIEVELLPLVGATFRYGSRGERSTGNSESARLMSSLQQISRLIDQTMVDLGAEPTNRKVGTPIKTKKARF